MNQNQETEKPYYQRQEIRNRETKELFEMSTSSDGLSESQFEIGFGKLLKKRLEVRAIEVTGFEISDYRRNPLEGHNPWILVNVSIVKPAHLIRMSVIQKEIRGIFPAHSDIQCEIGDMSIFEDTINVRVSVQILNLFDNYDDRERYDNAIRALRK